MIGTSDGGVVDMVGGDVEETRTDLQGIMVVRVETRGVGRCGGLAGGVGSVESLRGYVVGVGVVEFDIGVGTPAGTSKMGVLRACMVQCSGAFIKGGADAEILWPRRRGLLHLRCQRQTWAMVREWAGREREGIRG